MRFIVLHIPHIVPVLIAFAFLGRLAVVVAEQPPAQLSDEEIDAWHRARAERAYLRRVRGSTSRLGMWALVPLAVAFATGLWLYTEALRDDRPSSALSWVHTVFSVAGLALIALKLADLGRVRLARGLSPRRILTDGASLVLAALGVPLVATGVILLAAPSNGSASAYIHLVASVWWSVL